ncbi:MAG: hypothetical protein IT385_02955 [Deltaproteobacteria bacterium]|nr:hypothetical protein [Deltaproteobacteria bacterium]
MRKIAMLSAIAAGVAGLAAGAAGCPDYDDKVAPTTTDPTTTTDSGGDSEVVTGGTTWHKDVKPLVVRHCVSCHVAGGIATMPLDTYEATAAWRAAMVERVNTTDARERMPPWPMDPNCRDVIDARVLTPLEKAVFTDWKADGYLEGNAADYVPPVMPDKPALGAPDIVVSRSPGYVPRIVEPDDYRCFLLPNQVASETWVRAVEIKPDHKAIVHHVLLFVVPPSEVGKLEAKDAADATPGYDCLGNSGADGDALLSGWVPGMLPVVFPPGSGFRVPAGSRFVMQMHYNTANVDPPITPDATSAHLWTRGTQGLESEVRIRAVADPLLDIGPGENPAVEGVTVRSPWSEEVIGVIPHMHLLGSSIEVTTRRIGGTTDACLARIPQWDFHWQQTYQYRGESLETASDYVKVRIGDEVKLSCTYDNSQGTETVRWGENTDDEMCLAYLVTLTPRYSDGGGGVCDGFTNCMKDCPTSDALCPLDCMSWAGGNACIGCALGPVYTECAQGEGAGCGALLLGLGGCYQGCVSALGQDATPGQKVLCAIETCRSELDAFYGGCLETLIRAGKCNDEAEACGIGPVTYE